MLILIPLYFASIEDMKYHRIDKKYVIIILLIVLVYTLLTREYVIERTFSLLITLGLFSFLTFVSKGGFGFGDTLILTSLGWYIGSLTLLMNYYYMLVGTTLVFGGYILYKTRKENGKSFKDYFKIKETLPIDKVKPGMVLSDDYFMMGLNEDDIQDLKKQGKVYLEVKQAYPFIPIIAFSFLIFIFVF